MTNQENALQLEGFEELKADFMKSEAFHEMAKAHFLEGEAKGRLEGERAGEAAVPLRQVTRRFGEVPEDAQARIRGATSDQLLRWADRVLDAPTLAAVFAKDS